MVKGRIIFNNLLHTQYQNSLHIYTDGSRLPAPLSVGAAIYSPQHCTATAWRLPASASILMAELFAIRVVVIMLQSKEWSLAETRGKLLGLPYVVWEIISPMLILVIILSFTIIASLICSTQIPKDVWNADERTIIMEADGHLQNSLFLNKFLFNLQNNADASWLAADILVEDKTDT